MSKSLAFWILMLLIVLFWPPWPFWPSGWPNWAGYAALILAVALLGWEAFGPPLR